MTLEHGTWLEHPDSVVLRRLWSVAHELPDTDETVLFDESASELLVLSDTAAALWYLIDGKRTVSDIIRYVTEARPDAPADTALLIVGFLDGLVKRGAVGLAESRVDPPCT